MPLFNHYGKTTDTSLNGQLAQLSLTARQIAKALVARCPLSEVKAAQAVMVEAVIEAVKEEMILQETRIKQIEEHARKLALRVKGIEKLPLDSSVQLLATLFKLDSDMARRVMNDACAKILPS